MKKFALLFCIALCAFDSYSHEKASPPSVILSDFKLTGDLANGQANFTLTATARVESRSGGSLELLSGPVALTEITTNPRWTLRPEQNRFVAVFERRGTFPIRVRFTAAVQKQDGWRRVEFCVAQTALQPVTLSGLSPDTEFDFRGAARPERTASTFTSYLPPDGRVNLGWKEARPEGEGKLFYSAEMLSQISVSPGLLRQTALVDFKVMQGELTRATVRLTGEGEVTRVQGDHLLAWNLEPLSDPKTKRLVLQFNQPQKDQFTVQIQMQTTLGSFPQTNDVMGLRPEAATRFAGHFRIVNEGAVRLEILKASGLTQISPEQFPESDASKAVLRVTGNQRFVYRFSGEDYALRILADQIVPEVSVSELLAYRLGENELAIDSELELEIREAPLRELLIYVPKNYAVARINASGLADYFLSEPEGKDTSELRLVFSQPISGRQLVELRLERNKPLAEPTWLLPRIEIAKAKSVRGHIAVAADVGFRVTPERTQALTEIATAFFPRKVPGIQTAFRLSDAAWQASVRVERLAQTVQADGLHLFSIGEGIAYGSSLINYVISGAPISAFRVQLSTEYFNVEFTGKDIRNWQRTEDGYLVQLHTPVSGAYTLLATYERPFKSQGDTLTFTGIRPLDAQSEQGHTLIVSDYQFQVRPVEVSPVLTSLEPGEVPTEYRLFFDAPILAAYHYVTQPFNLKLTLSPLVQGDSLSQVVDRAVLSTKISKEGQILTEVHYFIKSRGNPNFRLSLPKGTELWSATVNGAAVVPVSDAGANLIPLPQGLDPNAVINLELQLAAKASNPEKIDVSAPITGTPVMLTEWKLEPDAGQQLLYRRGSLKPTGGVLDSSGFAQLARLVLGDQALPGLLLIVVTPALLFCALIAWRRAHAAIGLKRGTLLAGGTLAVLVGLVCFLNLLDQVAHQTVYLPRQLMFLAPIQQAGSVQTIQVANVPDKAFAPEIFGNTWPILLALPLWFAAWASNSKSAKRICWLAGWAILAWTALHAPNGGVAFLILVLGFALINAIIPALIQLVRSRPEPEPSSKPISGAAPAATALGIGTLIWISAGSWSAANAQLQTISQPSVSQAFPARTERPVDSIAESVIQEARVEADFVFVKAALHWRADKGEALPILFEPGILTGISYPTNSLKLAQSVVPKEGDEASAQTNRVRAQVLTAQRCGVFDIEVRYQLQVQKRGPETGFELPVGYGLVNRLDLTVKNSEVDISCPQAVSILRAESSTNTAATLVLSPAMNPWVGWRPRARDVAREKAIFYTEMSQLYVPGAGVIEGVHLVSIRPAQGELHELILDVPPGVSVTDVSGFGTNELRAETKVPGSNTSLVSLWRFDPDTRKLRITLGVAQSRPFSLLVRSQTATGALPLEHKIGLLNVDGAADQLGLVGIATGSDVQLDSVTPENLSPINLEDFPADLATWLQPEFSNLAVRRAFRYSNTSATAVLKATAVEPDVRVESQDTISLGEDRTVLAVNASVEITRAGIFRMSFEMPAAFEVESISGSALSHWTELKTETGRTITLHLNGKTEGKQQFAITLASAGLKATNSWSVPQLVFREAAKQRGTLLIVPEQGLRLQAKSSEGLTQLDPQKSGIKQKGVLAFRALQSPHTLILNVERVDPWIQVTSLQQSTVTEAQIKVAANLQYQIENTGLKGFRVLIPTNAEAVRFEGDQVADFLPAPGSVTNGLQTWNITLHRRVIGQYTLQASYQVVLPGGTSQAALHGLQVLDINAQRGFLTVRAVGRLQVTPDPVPAALQAAEWQSIPRALQQGLPAAAASFSYRLVEASFQLPLKIERHEAARLLPARINSISLKSVISDDGVMLTHVQMEMLPGDKRLLNLTLPKEARFWFAFVNRNGTWPWREQDRILIPLEHDSHGGKAIPVELFYSCRVGNAVPRSLDLDLLAPKFDLPLENLTWRVSLDRKWKVKKWSGSFQLQQDEIVAPVAGIDLERYLQSEIAQQHEQNRHAEELLANGNSALAQGEPQQARRAFQAAYELSGHDSAFNEDARVQLHNIKLQQALIGLNVRQANTSGDTGTLAGKLRDLRSKKEPNYTQQDAKDIIDRNSADENAVYMRLAERLIQQQDAAVNNPSALRTSIPDQGRVLTFKRAVVVDPWADLKIRLVASETQTAGWQFRALSFLIALGLFLSFVWAGHSWSRTARA
jgi:hypothetical protein